MAEQSTDPEELRLRILHALRNNGRASYSRIASQLGIPRQQVARIVQQAIERGELRLTVSISPDLLGHERFAYLQLTVTGPTSPAREALTAMPETTFVADISGTYAIDAEIRVGPDPHLRDTVDTIRALPGVRGIRTHLYESIEVNLYSPLRTGRTSFAIDDADRIIVQHLQQDGRASLRELGDAAGISPSGARLRLARLTRHGAVKVVGIPVRGARSEIPSLGVGITAGGRLEDAIAYVRTLGPEFLAVTVGDYDLIATLSADTSEDLVDLADRLRSHPEVSAMDTWANLRVVKEQYGEGDRISASPRRRRDADPAGSPRPAGP
ncbi:Lrp/AsnC family transcriptional regulator [Leucobacter sp. wl10]|uniref:Lrp/AsnC family transcriptional regulator n=1 Tax=Leucobacter sp. wl10 TaxID=2304677 RepID=UPI000E5ACE08|nr:Lrp/AsnC family transcriptional regulator [Leucobacter sp. wl10]RGE23106.1 Lrp/AsnC family transcriptional regulator [Leucobacter sp. wl10]